MGKYGDWTITVDGDTAVAEKWLNGNALSLRLARVDGQSYDCLEGWWPHLPTNIQCVIGGICLWCHRWTVYFEAFDSKSQPARRYPASEIDRKEVVERILKGGKGSQVTHMDVPIEPRAYHVRTIERQARAAREFEVGEIYYHVPVTEYHRYIAEIEAALGRQLPELHALLDQFAEKIRKLILEKFAGIKVIFIDPTPFSNGDSNGSFVFPYWYPELLGIDPDGLVGLENMVEVRLSWEALQRGGSLVPVYAIATGIPYPYREKSSDMNGVVVLRLSP